MSSRVVKNLDANTVLAYNLRIAETFFLRLKGLLGTEVLPMGQGLLIRPCNSVHTIGMRYPIDVLFLSKDFRVLRIVANMPSRRGASCFASAMVLELPAGTALQTGSMVGHQLELT